VFLPCETSYKKNMSNNVLFDRITNLEDKMKKVREKSKIIYLLIYLFMAVFLGYGLTLTDSGKETISTLKELEKQGYVLLFVWGYLCIFLVLFKMRKKLALVRKSDFLFFLIILASIPRIFIMLQNHYIPTNDFKNYYEAGVHLIEGDKAVVREFVGGYNIAKFGGLAVFMGITAKLFSVKLIGFQTANVIITSLICVFIYLIIEDYNKKSAMIASILFAIYPENIISTQITTNHHGAILFTLISIFCLAKAEHRHKYIFCILGGVALAISDLIHPSISVPIVAILCYGIVGGGVKKSGYLRIKNCLLILLCYVIAINMSFTMLRAGGILESNAKNPSPSLHLGKIVTGFNHETRGRWSQEDAITLSSMSREEKREWQETQIKERIFDKPFNDILSLMRDKIDITWFQKGAYFVWYWEAWYANIVSDKENGEVPSEELDRELETFSIYTSYQLFDWIFIKIIYIFAIWGFIIVSKSRRQNTGIALATWILLGWIMIHLFIEVQERYRYLGMPYIFIFAAIGMYESYRRLALNVRARERIRRANKTISEYK